MYVKDEDVLRIIKDARKTIHLLNPIFATLIESLLSIDWIKRNDQIVNEYSEFVVDLLVAHNKYSNLVVRKLISVWIPDDTNIKNWIDNQPTGVTYTQLKIIHKLIAKILNAVPMAFEVVAETIEETCPYYKQRSCIVSGFVHNVLWLLKYQPDFLTIIIEMLFKRYIYILN